MDDDTNRGATDTKDEARAKGGRARAEALSPSERVEIARNAALARWAKPVPQESETEDSSPEEVLEPAPAMPE